MGEILQLNQTLDGFELEVDKYYRIIPYLYIFAIIFIDYFYRFNIEYKGQGTAIVLERTQKIFFVCCTRAKESLAVLYHNPKSEVITKTKEWFVVENILKVINR